VSEIHTGTCVGGPLDGTEVAVRSADGFLATDRAAGKAWVYKQQPDGTFAVSTDHDDTLVYPQGATTGERTLDEARSWQAGLEMALDVIAVDEAD
jgi:hypothetical protein